MKSYRMNPLLVLVLILPFFLVHIAYADQSTSLTYAFSDGDPPTSYSDETGLAKGVLPELAFAAFELIEGYDVALTPYPWKRAKLLAENGKVDGLLTYPSQSRQAYMLFSDTPTYIIDYGYIIYNRYNPNAGVLNGVQDSEQLTGFTLVTEGPESNDSWEEENLPLAGVPRIYKQNITQMFHQIFLRNSGDFFIRNLEEAKFIANQLGYLDQFAFKKVTFKTDNSIPFHLGIHKSHPDAEIIIDKINRVQASDKFKAKAEEILRRYQ